MWCLILFKTLSSMATRGQRLCSTIAPVVSRSNVASSWILEQWIKFGEHPTNLFLRVDQNVKELERAELTVDLKDFIIDILLGLAAKYDTEVRVDDSVAT